MLKKKTPHHKDHRSFKVPLLVFDLPTLVEKMKHEPNTKVDFDAMILLKSPDRQIVLTRLNEGTKIKSVQSNDLSTFQIIEGKLRIRTRKESVILDKGQLLTVHENMKYSLTTKEETVFLLTIANSNLQSAKNKCPDI